MLIVRYPYHIVEREIGFVQKPKKLQQRVLNAYVMWHISRQFGGAWNELPVTPLPVHYPLATDSQLQSAVEQLMKGARPLLLIGSQAMCPPTKPDELRATVEVGGPVLMSATIGQCF